MRTKTIAAAAALLAALPAVAGAAPRDRNRDGIPDTWEKRHKLSLVAGQDGRDQDHDGLTNLVEWQAGTNPRRRDSDRDGRPDGREDGDRDGLRNAFEGRTGHDAGDPDTDGDGIEDGREGAGRVVRVAGATVTIDLGAGRRARARIEDDTSPRCGAAGDWLLGLLDLADPEDELAEDDGAGEGGPDELLPALRTVQEDGEEPEDAPGTEPAAGEDEPADEPEEADEAEGSCPDGAVRTGTWIHSSNAAQGVFTWLDVVVPDED